VKIEERRQGAVTVLRPEGPLTRDDADLFAERAKTVLTSSLGRFVIDASAMPYADSRGLEVLLDLTELLGDSGQALKLCAESETLREALELTDLAGLFEHFEDVQTAARSFL